MKTLQKGITITVLAVFLGVCMAVPLYAAKSAPKKAIEKIEKVNINTADKAQLTTLKYVGEKLAERIISHRKKTPFKSVEDLMKVKGIGKKVLKANKDRIII